MSSFRTNSIDDLQKIILAIRIRLHPNTPIVFINL